jgi:hypothetical protein
MLVGNEGDFCEEVGADGMDKSGGVGTLSETGSKGGRPWPMELSFLGVGEIGVGLALPLGLPALKGDEVPNMLGLAPIPVMFSTPGEMVLGI